MLVSAPLFKYLKVNIHFKITMGASKAKFFSKEEIQLSMVGRALAHPARIAIVNHLKEFDNCRCIDLVALLQLAPSTIHQHILKLKEANVVEVFYKRSSYLVCLQSEAITEFSEFVHHVAD